MLGDMGGVLFFRAVDNINAGASLILSFARPQSLKGSSHSPPVGRAAFTSGLGRGMAMLEDFLWESVSSSEN